MLREAESGLRHELEHYDDSVARDYHFFETYLDRSSGEFRANIIKRGDFFSCEIPDTGQYILSFWFRVPGMTCGPIQIISSSWRIQPVRPISPGNPIF